MTMIPVSSSVNSMNHAATDAKCADEGLEMQEGQTWGYFSEQGRYETDSLGDRCLVSTSPVLLEFYSLVSRISSKKARKSTGLGPTAAKCYQWWRVVVTSAATGQITTRVQSFPRLLKDSGYRRIS